MRKESSMVRQAAILAAATLIVRFIGLLYRIPLTALIGDEGNAFYLAAFSVYSFGMVITSGALATAVSKLVSERVALGRYIDAHKLFKNGIYAAAIMGSIIALIMALGANRLTQLRFFIYPEATIAIRVLAPTVLIVAMVAVFRGYFIGMKAMAPTAISQVVERIFDAVFSLWLALVFTRIARVELAVAGAAAGTGIGVLAGLVTIVGFYLPAVRKLRAKKDESDGTEKRSTQLKALFSAALPIILGMGIYQVANFIDLGMAKDRIMASGAFTLEEVDRLVGQFTGKFILLTTLPVSLSVALSQAVIPGISSSVATMDKEAVRDKINTALKVSMVISIPAVVGLTALANPILTLLFPYHQDGGRLLRYGAVSIIFLALIHVSTGVLQGIGKFMLPVIVAFIGVLIKIPINWYLLIIPEINILGAVIGTLACYLFVATMNIIFIYKYTGVLPVFKDVFLKPAIAATGMGFACVLTYNAMGLVVPGRPATIMALIIGVPVYLALLWTVKGVPSRRYSKG